MHDWTLLSILYDWGAARVTLALRRPDGAVAEIVAEGVSRLNVPRLNKWGPSVSVYKILGPANGEGQGGDHAQQIAVEMQSGDVITVVAASFCLPEAGNQMSLLARAGK
jgi:hypothetical protein